MTNYQLCSSTFVHTCNHESPYLSWPRLFTAYHEQERLIYYAETPIHENFLDNGPQ